MPRVVVLEWDDREARVAIGNVRPDEVTVEQAFVVPLEEASAPASIGERIGAALAEHQAQRLDVIVGIGRSNIELRVLSLPPAPPDDRPDLVRFAAQKEFTALRDDWPVDYVELGETSEGGIQVLAAVLAGDQVRHVRTVCSAWDTEPKRLVLRPFAAASLWNRNQPQEAPDAVLLIDLLESDVDLTVLVDGQATFLRTVRLPETSDREAQANALVGEMRRTMVAARSQMGGRQVQQIVVLGKADDHADLLRVTRERLDQDVVAFDPFSVVSLGRKAKREMPDRSGRFAPLLGILLDEASGATHAVDFLHPKRRPAPPSKRNRVVGWSAAIAAVAFLVVGYYGWQYVRLGSEIARLEERVREMQPVTERSDGLIRHERALNEFEQSNVTWIDEIAEMAKRIPPAEEMIITDFSLGVGRVPGGQAAMKGYVTEPDLIHEVEESLRYRNNKVAGKRGTRETARKGYQWMFDVVVLVPPDRIKFGRPIGRPPIDDSAKKRTAESSAGDATPSRSDDGAESSEPEKRPSSSNKDRLTSAPSGGTS